MLALIGSDSSQMKSLAIVETLAGINPLHYLVTQISNVLYKNSAVDHQTLATYIHRLVAVDSPVKPTPPVNCTRRSHLDDN